MTIQEFRKKVKPYEKLLIDGREFMVREIIKFRFDDGSYYVKCLLNNGYVLADDEEREMFLLVREVRTLFTEPFGDSLDFDGKKYKFLYKAHAVAEEVSGSKFFKKGESETFWDFMAEDGSYLSLGKKDGQNKRLDFCGKTINPDLAKLHDSSI